MEQLNKKIFKSYDIRGIYPDDLNEETAYIVGQAYIRLTGAKKIVVGRDMRIGSPELAAKFIKGATSQGANVLDIGMVPIDAVYFTTGKYKYGGGIMITASHNPKEYNGLKMTVLKDGIEMIRGIDLYDFLIGKKFTAAGQQGSIEKKDIIDEYIEHVLSFGDISKIKPFKIVVDAGNGLAGKIIPILFKKLPCEYIPLNFELDGNFPGHPSNPLLPESQIQLKKKVAVEKADFGIIFDGDTDRLFFVSEKGEFIKGDTNLLLLAKYFLAHEPNAGIAYNAVCTKAVPAKVAEMGGRPIRTPVGFVNVADGLKKNNGVVGGEVSGHYCFRDNYYSDSGFIALIILLMLISESGKPLSEIAGELNPYSKADEVNIEVDDIPGIIAQVKEKYSSGQQDELDGLTVTYGNWWVNVRPSNTEPLLRITVEGDTEEILKKRQTEIVSFIKSIAKK